MKIKHIDFSVGEGSGTNPLSCFVSLGEDDGDHTITHVEISEYGHTIARVSTRGNIERSVLAEAFRRVAEVLEGGEE